MIVNSTQFCYCAKNVAIFGSAACTLCLPVFRIDTLFSYDRVFNIYYIDPTYKLTLSHKIMFKVSITD